MEDLTVRLDPMFYTGTPIELEDHKKKKYRKICSQTGYYEEYVNKQRTA